MQSAVEILNEPRQVAALAHPVRGRILEAMQIPETAASVARQLGGTRQAINYHVKALAGLGLLQRTGERRNGNFVEQLFQSTARRFVVASRFAADPDQLAAVFRDHVSLAALTSVGERLQRDAVRLIDAAASGGKEIPSVSIEADVALPDESARTAFMRDVSEALQSVLAKHATPTADGRRFRVVFATYPEEEDDA